jgi:hypothetical protein
MRVLIVATHTTPPGLSDEVRVGRHQRVDYLELAQRFGTMYHDYNALRSKSLAAMVRGSFSFRHPSGAGSGAPGETRRI